MANNPESSELDIAKRALAAARQRTSDRIGSPNLNKFGKEKPLVAAAPQERPKSAAALQNEHGNGREKSVKQVEKEIVGDSIVLMGKVRVMKAAHGNVGQKKQAHKLAPTLTVPMAGNSRVANKDGATSFHFKHEAIAETMHDKVSAGGTKIRKNAGRDHSQYLERDSAVARNGEAVDRGNMSEDEKVLAQALGQAAAGGLYIEREEALAHQENGVAAIYSNISQDADERHRFWESVEKHETEPSPDHLKIVTGQAPEFWEAVRTDPRCPKQLALAIKEADPSKPYRVRTDDNEYIREIMAHHGWAPPKPRGPNETAAEKEVRQRIDQLNSKGAHCEDGRGGRIQNRIVGELPYEVSHGQRIRIVRKFAAEFEEKNLPYVAVMHAPDHANNDKNWHFHLAYYERPCSRFTGEEENYLTPLKPNANWHDEARHKAKEKAFKSGELEQYIGQWDFAVPMERKMKSRNKITTYPFAQDKDRDCTKRSYPLKLRKILAEITNDELEIAGADRRVDPRRFVEMGITKEAEEHLGTRSAQMELLGIATPRGVENEHRQWLHTLYIIEKKLKADQRDVVNGERRWRQTLESHRLNARNHAEMSDMITAWAKGQAEAKELTAIAMELKAHLERARSRALKVQETCARHLEAIAGGKATKRQRDNKDNYLARWVEATDHQAGLMVTMAAEIANEKQTREDAVRLTDKADKLHHAIGDRILDERAAMALANNNREHVNASYLARIHLNDDIDNEQTCLLDRSRSAAAAAATEALSPTQIMRKIDDIIKEQTPIICEIRNGQPFFSLTQHNLKAIGLTDSDLTDRHSQLRLGGMHNRQESEINRLVGFIRRSPARTISSPPTSLSNNQTIVGLDKNAPYDLRVLSLKFAEHPIAQHRMREALRETNAKLDKANVQKAKERHTESKLERLIDDAPVELRNVDASPLTPPSADTVKVGPTGGRRHLPFSSVCVATSKTAVTRRYQLSPLSPKPSD